MKIAESQLRRLIRNRLLLERKKEDRGEVRGRKSSRASRDRSSSDSSDSSFGDSRSFSGSTGGGQGEGERESQGGAVVIKLPGDDGEFTDPNLVYVYPGVGQGGYGRQGWVADNIQSEVGLSKNTIIIVANTKGTSWSKFKRQGIDAYKEATGEDQEPDSGRMVGWSAGADGLSQSTSDGFLNSIWYADPSPTRKLINANHGSSVKMYFNPENWNISGFDTDSGFASLKEKLGDSAILVDNNHNDIFFQSMREAMA